MKHKKPNGIKKEVKEEVKREIQREKQWRGTGHSAWKMSERLAMASNNGIDVGYIKTLLFPELYNADVPQPLSTQSYCRFSDKKEYTFESKGAGLLIWYPKTMTGPQLFISSTAGNEGQELNFAAITSGTVPPWKCGGMMDYSEYFSQGSLVSASLQIQYVG